MSTRGSRLPESRPRWSTRATVVVAIWLFCLACAALVTIRTRYVTDLSALLPTHPSPAQRVLVEQLRDGAASRLVLAALEGGDPATQALVSRALAHRLRQDPAFSLIEDGERTTAERDRQFLFEHRYLLSEAVSAERFSAAGLHRAIESTIEDLASPAGLLLRPLVPRDPTGEMQEILEQLSRTAVPRTRDGVWVSAHGERTVLLAQVAASGSDIDAQDRALRMIRTAFAQASREAGATAQSVQLRLSGPPVFAVEARARIQSAAERLAALSASLIVLMMWRVYRRGSALVLGLLPVATGALVGMAAVAFAFGEVHGTTLGFGATLIGESVDYSIYFFIQGLPDSSGAAVEASWRQRLWPTVRLGMLASVCGFASLLPSGFPGLAQLGTYSISGLVAAAAVTRFVLPELLPAGFAVRDLTPFGLRALRWLSRAQARGAAALFGVALAIAAAAALILIQHRADLWNRELSALSPIPIEQQRFDVKLRADVGAADALDLVVVSGPDLESVLRGAERAALALDPLIDGKFLGGVDSPSYYLPSLAAQTARRASLPEPAVLRENLRIATAGLPLEAGKLEPFLKDVEAARHGALIGPQELRGTSLAAGFDALVLHEADHWSAILPLHPANPAAPSIDADRVRGALTGAGATDARLLDLKAETDALYAGYLKEAIRMSLGGIAAIVVLLMATLRSTARVLRVLAPLFLAVLAVAAGLSAAGVQLNLLHLVGMLLIVAVGSNYALFFDADARRGEASLAPRTLASLIVANMSTVIGFGVLSLSHVPVLVALGSTVAPGAFLALVFAALLTCRAPQRRFNKRVADA